MSEFSVDCDSERPSVAVVDDDEDMRFILSASLQNQQFEVVSLDQNDDAIGELDALDVDIVLLDIELGHLNGLSILEDLRSRSNLPVILLTSRGDEMDRVRGLDLGADDYVVKPFLPRELGSRIRAVLRRLSVGVPPNSKLNFGELGIDAQKREVTIAGGPVHLTRIEFDLLFKLASNPSEVFSRERLLQEVWKSESEWQDRETVTEHISRLRAKTEGRDGAAPHLITVRGVGYRFEP